jgi:hypothetical protein
VLIIEEKNKIVVIYYVLCFDFSISVLISHKEKLTKNIVDSGG